MTQGVIQKMMDTMTVVLEGMVRYFLIKRIDLLLIDSADTCAGVLQIMHLESTFCPQELALRICKSLKQNKKQNKKSAVLVNSNYQQIYILNSMG